MGIKVLIVDDDCGFRAIFRYHLESCGYQVAEACNGIEALDYLQKQTRTLVMTDYDMPGCNGFELVSIIKNSWSQLPVLLISSHLSEEQEQWAEGLGVDAVLRKSIEPPELLRVIDKALQKPGFRQAS